MRKFSAVYSEEELGKIIKMIEKNKSFSEIGEEMGRPEFGVYLKCRSIKKMMSSRIGTPTNPGKPKLIRANIVRKETRSKQKPSHQSIQHVTSYLSDLGVPFIVNGDEKLVKIYKDPKPIADIDTSKHYRYYYQTGKWATSFPEKKIYRSSSIENFMGKFYRTTEQDKNFWSKENSQLKHNKELAKLAKNQSEMLQSSLSLISPTPKKPVTKKKVAPNKPVPAQIVESEPVKVEKKSLIKRLLGI